MYLTIKAEQMRGNNFVDSFYRKKNLESLISYKNTISSENKMREFYK
jgi:hypothetical protein